MSFNKNIKNFVKKEPGKKNIDNLVNNINKKIGKLLGKKNGSGNGFQNPYNKIKIKNWIFGLIIAFLLIFLWTITGFYYLSDSQYGVVIRNGKVINVAKGIKFGLNAPYPIDQLQLISAAVSENITTGKASPNDSDYIILSRDLKPFQFTANFTYQIVDPKILFLSVLQDEDKVNMIVKWKVMTAVRQYISTKMETELANANLIVTANEIRDKLNHNLSIYGIKINKFNIEALKKFKVRMVITNNKEQSSLPIVDKLLSVANEYHQNQIASTKVNIDKFNELLKQYQKTPQNIIEQMYYDTLLAIPSSIQNNYDLLNMNLNELILLSNQNELFPSEENTIRDPSRLVRRYRNISE